MYGHKLVAALIGLGLWPIFVHAGLYNLAEPWERLLKPNVANPTNPRPLDWSSFVFTHSQLRSIGLEGVLNDNPIRVRYRLVTDLVPRLVPSGIDTEGKISLAAYLTRRGKHREAIRLLKLPASREPKNSFVLANLGTAYELEGLEPEKAREYLRQASSVWPRSWSDLKKETASRLEQLGWDEATLKWYGEAEKHHLKLVTLRAAELARSGKPAETLDNLFSVEFKYDGTKLSPAAKARLPGNAIALVQQLLIWLPDDPRLYWLLGEVYHAAGAPEDVAAARQIFEDLAGFNGRYPVPEIRAHLHALGPAVPVRPEISTTEPEPTKSQSQEPMTVVFDPKPVLIGFGAGMLVTLMAMWQIREFRRRAARHASRDGKPPDTTVRA